LRPPRTSFHHQPEAQHPKIFSYPQAGPADYPIFRGQNQTQGERGLTSADDPKANFSNSF
jgi:hypothetical protein